MYVYTIYTRPRSVQARYSRSCPIISCFCYNGSLVTWTVVCLTTAKFKPLIFPVLINAADSRYIDAAWLGPHENTSTVAWLGSHRKDFYRNVGRVCVEMCLHNRCLAMFWANPSQYILVYSHFHILVWKSIFGCYLFTAVTMKKVVLWDMIPCM
jgi:hypothetical protein